MKKKQVVKICAIVLASLLAVGMLVPAITYIFAADTDEKVQTKEVPLLVLIVSFDANGNGKNDYSAINCLQTPIRHFSASSGQKPNPKITTTASLGREAPLRIISMNCLAER